MNQIEIEENNIDNSDFSWQDEIDLENLEMPQLVRRNGTTGALDIQAHIILEKNVSHIYNEEICPICLCEEEELFPLRCGHTFCENDIEIMLQNSKRDHNLIVCPLCRQYQCIDSFQEVCEFKKQSQLVVQNSQQLS